MRAWLVIILIGLAGLAWAASAPKPLPQVILVTPPPAPDVSAPMITILQPGQGTTVQPQSQVLITMAAADNVRVTMVQVTINGQALSGCRLFEAPYQCPWQVPKQANQRYTINAMAIDAAGNNGQSQVEVLAK